MKVFGCAKIKIEYNMIYVMKKKYATALCNPCQIRRSVP